MILLFCFSETILLIPFAWSAWVSSCDVRLMKIDEKRLYVIFIHRYVFSPKVCSRITSKPCTDKYGKFTRWTNSVTVIANLTSTSGLSALSLHIFNGIPTHFSTYSTSFSSLVHSFTILGVYHTHFQHFSIIHFIIFEPLLELFKRFVCAILTLSLLIPRIHASLNESTKTNHCLFFEHGTN